jgi:hypothetical protein
MNILNKTVFNKVLIKNAINLRSIQTSGVARLSSFNVQDTEDFEKRVLNAQGPVIVDFHATFVQLLLLFVTKKKLFFVIKYFV